VAEKQWHKLLQSVGLELSQRIYTLINWFSTSDAEEGQRDKKKKATMKVCASRSRRRWPALLTIDDIPPPLFFYIPFFFFLITISTAFYLTNDGAFTHLSFFARYARHGLSGRAE
jgi:hypothetical protein